MGSSEKYVFVIKCPSSVWCHILCFIIDTISLFYFYKFNALAFLYWNLFWDFYFMLTQNLYDTLCMWMTVKRNSSSLWSFKMLVYYIVPVHSIYMFIQSWFNVFFHLEIHLQLHFGVCCFSVFLRPLTAYIYVISLYL